MYSPLDNFELWSDPRCRWVPLICAEDRAAWDRIAPVNTLVEKTSPEKTEKNGKNGRKPKNGRKYDQKNRKKRSETEKTVVNTIGNQKN